MGWIQRQIEEIERDRALQWFGLALALANALTFVYWKDSLPVAQILAPGATPICWPFFSNCYAARVFSAGTLDALLWGYLAVSVAAALAFAHPRFARIGYWILVALLFYRGFFLFQDYRLRLNQHYMLYWSMLAFLLVPAKRAAIRYLVISFYFWAGILKTNPEWVSGAALAGESPLLVPTALIPAACAYVVILELVLVFGLLSKRAVWFWGTLAQLALFHLTSWSIVGFYYPLLMVCIVSIFVLDRLIRPPPPPQIANARSRALARRVALGALLGGFFGLQLLPYAYPGDSAITGEGRFFALHMFDSALECDAIAAFRKRVARDGSRFRGHRRPAAHAAPRRDPLAARHGLRTLLRDRSRVSDLRAQRLDPFRFRAAVTMAVDAVGEAVGGADGNRPRVDPEGICSRAALARPTTAIPARPASRESGRRPRSSRAPCRTPAASRRGG